MANRSHGRRFLGIGSSEVPTTRWADSDLLFGESPLVLPEDVAQYNGVLVRSWRLHVKYGVKTPLPEPGGGAHARLKMLLSATPDTP